MEDRLLAAMTWLASGASTFALPLGTSVHGDLNIRPLEFVSPVALNKHARDEKEPEPDDEADDDDDEPEDEP